MLGTTKLPTDLSVADRLADSEVVPLAVSESDIETAKSLAEVLTDRGSVGTEEMAAAGPERGIALYSFPGYYIAHAFTVHQKNSLLRVRALSSVGKSNSYEFF